MALNPSDLTPTSNQRPGFPVFFAVFLPFPLLSRSSQSGLPGLARKSGTERAAKQTVQIGTDSSDCGTTPASAVCVRAKRLFFPSVAVDFYTHKLLRQEACTASVCDGWLVCTLFPTNQTDASRIRLRANVETLPKNTMYQSP